MTDLMMTLGADRLAAIEIADRKRAIAVRFARYGVAAFGIRVNTFANSRTALASLAGKPYPVYSIPLMAGMSIGMVLISVELVMMLIILLFVFPEIALWWPRFLYGG